MEGIDVVSRILVADCAFTNVNDNARITRTAICFIAVRENNSPVSRAAEGYLKINYRSASWAPLQFCAPFFRVPVLLFYPEPSSPFFP